LIREISRKFPDTRRIEVRNDLGIDILAKCVVTAAGNIYIDIEPIDLVKSKDRLIRSHYYDVIPIEEVDY
jgi:hypothetical protein